MRPGGARTVLACGLLLAGVAAGAGAAETTAAPIGRVSFSISQCDTPIVLKFSAPRKPVAVRTEDIPPSAGHPAPAWTLTWDTPAPGEAGISEYSSSGKFSNGCPSSAGVTIPVSVRDAAGVMARLSIAVALAQPAKPWTPASLAVILTRTPIYSGDGPGYTIDVPVREIGGSTPLPPVSVWSEPLKTSDNSGATFSLQPSPPVAVPAGAAAPTFGMSLRAKGDIQPGVYSTNLYLTYAGVSDAKVTPLTLKVRVWRGFLFVLILVGVLAGWYLNKVVTVRLDLETARAAALRQARTLLTRASGLRDPEDQRRITQIAYTLQTGIARAATVDDIKAAQSAADDAMASGDKASASLATKFQQDFAAQKAIYLPPAPFEPAVASRIASSLSRLREIAALADSGDVSDASNALSVSTPAFETDTIRALQTWMVEILDGLALLGNLTDPDFTAARDRLRGDATTAFKAASAEAILPAANLAAGDLRAFALLTAPPAIAAALQAASDAAAEPLKPMLRELARTADASGALGDALAIIARLSQLRRRAEDALLQVSDTAAIRRTLKSGNFVAAVQSLPGALDRLAAAPQRALVSPKPVDRDPSGVSAPLAAPAPLIVAPPRLEVGETRPASVVWPAGAPPSTDAVKWTVNPTDGASVSVHGSGAVVKGEKAGFVVLTAAGDGWSVSAPIAIADPLALPEEAAQDEIRKLTDVLTGVAVVATTGLGYTLFQQTWLGTFNDGFAAVIWGTFGQFGLERVRTAVQPILTKTLAA